MIQSLPDVLRLFIATLTVVVMFVLPAILVIVSERTQRRRTHTKTRDTKTSEAASLKGNSNG